MLSLMAAESDEHLGYSNVLTVTRGRTIRGQVPSSTPAYAVSKAAACGVCLLNGCCWCLLSGC